MKILPPDKIQQLDQLTIEREPIESIDLMERASMALTEHFLNDFPETEILHIFCGPGNNGGDGLAIARLMDEKGMEVHVYILRFTENFSPDHLINSSRLINTNATVHNIEHLGNLPLEPLEGVIIDAVFGSGLNKELYGLPAEVVEFINQSDNDVVSVDIPSGVFAESTALDPAVRADKVYSFQIPKLAFLLPENEIYIKEWQLVDIGLHAESLLEMDTDHFYTTSEDIRKIFQDRSKYSHKGNYGHAMIIAGSKGKAGAAVLAAKAALKSGLGLLTMHVPSSILDIVQESIPEAMCTIDDTGDIIGRCPGAEEISKFSAMGIGPGIGQEPQTLSCMIDLFERYHHPIVIDADGLNLLSNHQDLFKKMPHLSVLTPHPGEFRRLVGTWENDYQKIELQKKLSRDFNVIVVLKGAHTCISDPAGRLYFNSTGNNGMATAGSGDTLTGLITGLLAQGYTSVDAAILGVYLHGLAGDLALSEEHENSVIASDIIRYIGPAFKQIEKD